jgi:hypothetical protein
MSDERPLTCSKCGAPEVWCCCCQKFPTDADKKRWTDKGWKQRGDMWILSTDTKILASINPDKEIEDVIAKCEVTK